MAINLKEVSIHKSTREKCKLPQVDAKEVDWVVSEDCDLRVYFLEHLGYLYDSERDTEALEAFEKALDDDEGSWQGYLDNVLNNDNLEYLDLIFLHEFQGVLGRISDVYEMKGDRFLGSFTSKLEENPGLLELSAWVSKVSYMNEMPSVPGFSVLLLEIRSLEVEEDLEKTFAYWKKEMLFYLSDMAFSAFLEETSLDPQLNESLYGRDWADNLMSWTRILPGIRDCYLKNKRRCIVDDGFSDLEEMFDSLVVERVKLEVEDVLEDPTRPLKVCFAVINLLRKLDSMGLDERRDVYDGIEGFVSEAEVGVVVSIGEKYRSSVRDEFKRLGREIY